MTEEQDKKNSVCIIFIIHLFPNYLVFGE